MALQAVRGAGAGFGVWYISGVRRRTRVLPAGAGRCEHQSFLSTAGMACMCQFWRLVACDVLQPWPWERLPAQSGRN